MACMPSPKKRLKFETGPTKKLLLCIFNTTNLKAQFTFDVCVCLLEAMLGEMGLSENSVPLHPMVNDHDPY